MGKTFEELIQVKIIHELLLLQQMWLHILSKITKPDIAEIRAAKSQLDERIFL